MFSVSRLPAILFDQGSIAGVRRRDLHLCALLRVALASTWRVRVLSGLKLVI